MALIKYIGSEVLQDIVMKFIQDNITQVYTSTEKKIFNCER